MTLKRLSIMITLTLLYIALTVVGAHAEELIKGVVVANDVNVRQESTIESTVIQSLKLGEYVTILDSNDEWYKVQLANDQVGWLHHDLVVPFDNESSTIKKGIINATNLNVRENPSVDSAIVGTLQNGTEVTILEENTAWFRINLNDGSKGWVHSDYVKTKSNYSTGQITGSNVNLRISPTIDGKVVLKLSQDSLVAVKDYKDGWYNIITSDDQEGWVHQDYLAIVLDKNVNTNSISRGDSRLAGFAKIGDFAKQYLGKPYKWASSGPNSFDCSGFTSFVYKNFGIKLPRQSSEQAKAGEKIAKSDLDLGDLVFFDTSGKIDGKITHVGMYLGNGQFIHASSGKSVMKVVISALNEGYYKDRYVTARRFF